MGPEHIETESTKSITMRQGLGFFGLRDAKYDIPDGLPRIEARPIEFVQSNELFQWPTEGLIGAERIALALVVGGGVTTSQALSNLISDISPVGASIEFGRNEKGNQIFMQDQATSENRSLGIVKRLVVSAFAAAATVLIRRKIYAMELDDPKGNRLASAFALAEAHMKMWREYGIPFNKFIAGGEKARRESLSEISIVDVFKKLATIEKPGQYFVRDIFPIKEGWSTYIFTAIEKAVRVIKSQKNIDRSNTALLLEYIPNTEGFLIINDRHIKEYEMLQDAGYYDGNPACQVVIVKDLTNEDGTINLQGNIMNAIYELQDNFPNGIPLEEVQNVIVQKYADKWTRLSPGKFRYRTREALTRENEIVIGEIDETTNIIKLNKKILPIHNLPLQVYDLLPAETKPLDESLKLRKEIMEYWLNHGGNKDMQVPVSEVRKIYARLMKEKGIQLTSLQENVGAKGATLTYKNTGETEPRIIVSENQLRRIKKMWGIINDVPNRYRFLAENPKGQEYIIEQFSHDLDESGDRISITEIPEDRQELIKYLVEEIKDYETTLSRISQDQKASLSVK
ncbi:MAG: hypothetical protein WCK31_00275 [bacterium]